MRFSVTAYLLIAFIRTSFSQVNFDKSLFNSSSGPVTYLPGRYIVEYAPYARMAQLSTLSTEAHDVFADILSADNIKAEVVYRYSSAAFGGASIQMNDDNSSLVERIMQMPEIQNVWPVAIHYTDTRVEENHSPTQPVWNPHSITGVDTVHKRGKTGQGIVIGVVDSGVNYKHPALGGGIGPGFKIEYGYDLVGKDWIPGNMPMPANDPMDCFGHGTHVSGIIVGQSESFIGVAPQASLRAYKVFGCRDGTTTDMLMAAFQMAFLDNVDIITSSIGSPQGFNTHPWAMMASRMVSHGTFVSISAGNSGHMGPFYANSGASGLNVAAVAASRPFDYSDHSFNTLGNGLIDSYSSWGPTYENNFYPSIAAPGSRIYSTWINNEFRIASGTSMSCPYIAGVAALFLAERYDNGIEMDCAGQEALNKLSTTAQSVSLSYHGLRVSEIDAPLCQQGAGLVNAIAMLECDTVLLSEPHIELMDLSHRVNAHSIILYNPKDVPVQFNVTNIPGVSFQSRRAGNSIYGYFPPLKPNFAGVTFSEDMIQIAAGSDYCVNVTFEMTKDEGIVVGGKIVFQNENEEISVPYMGE